MLGTQRLVWQRLLGAPYNRYKVFTWFIMRFFIFTLISLFLLQPAQGKDKKPKITGHKDLSTNQGQPIIIKLTDLFVQETGDDDDDEDDNDDHNRNAYPEGYTLEIFKGNNYEVSGNTVTPDQNFTGLLTVEVRVRNEKHASKKYALKITVKPANAPPENQPPVITGQLALSTPKDTPVKINLSDLTVSDPDNDYPSDFTLKVLPGDNYTVTDSGIEPKQDFTGDLFVKVSVNDGTSDSEVYTLKITVTADVNNKPIITGQVGLKIIEGQNLEIKLSHLVVDDGDNQYPEDFTLTILAGDNYTIANHTIIPVSGYLGTLQVKITVNDGNASSEPFDLKIEVVPQGKLEIVGQKSLEISEDSAITLRFSDLIVIDPTNTYPDGFDLQILKGENYEVNKGSITPHKNFIGNLTVPVAVSKGGSSSSPFSLLAIVNPVNDPPELLNLEVDPLVASGNGPWVLASNIEVKDVDDDQLLYVEIGFNTMHYQSEADELLFESTENIHGVFDSGAGILFLLGSASLDEYQSIIRSVKYNFKNNYSDTFQIQDAKTIYFKLNDGKDSSHTYKRSVLLEGNVALEIPTAFTPNNDNANDTWKIIPLKQVEQLTTFIRVYDKRGILVFETSGLDTEWDGYFNGAPLPADVYFYTIEMDLTYLKVNYKGIVSLLR